MTCTPYFSPPSGIGEITPSIESTTRGSIDVDEAFQLDRFAVFIVAADVALGPLRRFEQFSRSGNGGVNSATGAAATFGSAKSGSWASLFSAIAGGRRGRSRRFDGRRDLGRWPPPADGSRATTTRQIGNR